MNNFKQKNLFLIIFSLFLTLGFLSEKVYADEINFAVSPSKIVNMVIEPGKSETIKFKVGNRSVYPAHQTEKKDLYEVSVVVEGKITKQDGTVVDPTGIIKISDTLLKAKPNEKAAETTVEIKIPSDFEKNSYRVDIVFTRNPIKGIEDTTNTSAITSIKVPVYLGVGDPEEYANLKTDYEVKNLTVDLGEEKTVFKYALSNLKELITLNPFKVYNVFSGIKNKDIYVVNKDGKTSVDVLSGIYTELKNVVSYTKKTNDNKYVQISQEDENKEVSNVYFEDRVVDFKLSDGTSIKIECHNRVRDHIRSQINTLIKEHNLSKPRFKFFLDNLLVPSNKNFNILEYKASMQIENTGEKENFVSANIYLKKDSTYEVGSQKVELLTVMKGETIDVSIPLDITSEITSGSYALTANFIDVKNNMKTSVFNFTVDLGLDKTIFKVTLALYIALLALIGVLAYFIIKVLKDKKGTIGFMQSAYFNIEVNEENFNIYSNVFGLESVEDLSRLARISNNDTILRNKPSITDSKQVKVLHATDVVEILETNIESLDGNNTYWVKVRYKSVQQ